MSTSIDLSASLSSGEAAIGVDIGGTKTKAVAYGPDGPLAEARVPTVPGLPGILQSFRRVVERVRDNDVMSHRTIRSIGIGIPGLVNTAAGTVSHGVNVGLYGIKVPLASEAAALVRLPVAVVNDATAATLGAAHAAGMSHDAALISIGTGMAAGFILDGHPRTGFSASAGEIGHIPYIPEGLPCRCGQRGCLELYGSGRALDRMWPVPTGAKAGVQLFEAAAAGDEHAREVRGQWIAAIAHAVTLVGLTVDTEAILIGGGVTEIGEPLRAALYDELDQRAQKSAFLAHADLAHRCALMPPDIDVGSLGACLAGLTAL